MAGSSFARYNNNTLFRINQSWNGGPRGYPYYRKSYLTTLDFLRWLVDGSLGTSMTKLREPTCEPIYRRKKNSKLFAGLGSVSVEKNRPRSQFFTIRTSQPANNIREKLCKLRHHEICTVWDVFLSHYPILFADKKPVTEKVLSPYERLYFVNRV